MSANAEIERELAEIRADPRYGIEGTDEDLLLRELDLLIRQAYDVETERLARRRKPRRAAAPAAPQPGPQAPVAVAPVPVLPIAGMPAAVAVVGPAPGSR